MAVAADSTRGQKARGRSRSGAEVAVGKQGASAPAPHSALMERHRAAMRILHYDRSLSESEKIALLAAVVWPESRELLEREEAA